MNWGVLFVAFVDAGVWSAVLVSIHSCIICNIIYPNIQIQIRVIVVLGNA